MLSWYDWTYLVVSIGIIVICLLQGGKTEGASGAITGGGINVFVQQKERGSDKVLSIVTMCLTVVFFLFAIFINIFD